jgi:hypothetical protein
MTGRRHKAWKLRGFYHVDITYNNMYIKITFIAVVIPVTQTLLQQAFLGD